MSVTIEPAEQLEFHRPFTRISKESLHVKNPGTEPIIFKVKTTAPKQYCVRPNAGRIEPNSEIEVQIILQPFKEELPEDYKCKDKFLVQTAPINESFEQQDITTMWTHVETEEKASMHQHKIKCVFVGPREGDEDNNNKEIVAPIPEPTDIASSSSTSAAPAPINTTTTTNTTTTATSRDINAAVPVHGKVEEQTSPITSTPVTATPAAATSPVVGDGGGKETVAAAVLPTATTAPIETKPTTTTITQQPLAAPIAPSTTTIRNIDTTTDNKDKELKEALEKIKQLEKQLSELQKAEDGIRPRYTKKLSSTVQPLDAVHQHLAALEKPRPTEGYPPQVVLGVAALVFIFTYLFF